MGGEGVPVVVAPVVRDPGFIHSGAPKLFDLLKRLARCITGEKEGRLGGGSLPHCRQQGKGLWTEG